MSILAHSCLVFGIYIDDVEKLPWENDEFRGNIGMWWMKLHETDIPIDISQLTYNDWDIEYLCSVSPECLEGDHEIILRKWWDAHPCPFSTKGINHHTVLVWAAKIIEANMYGLSTISRETLCVTNEEVATFVSLCHQYDISMQDQTPDWYLGVYLK